MSVIEDKLIVALDVSSLAQAMRFVDILYPEVKMFKVGSQLFTSVGPEAVKQIVDKGAIVFLDLKFHDIPKTVYLGVNTGTSCYLGPSFNPDSTIGASRGVFMMTVHTAGGKAMMESALKGAKDKADQLKIRRPFIVGVTRLTSDENTANIKDDVLKAARLAKESGLDGIVCAPTEVLAVRKEFGGNFIIVTPAIRQKDSPPDDQKRTATAAEAIAAGSDFLVVGRPILQAKDPLKAAKELI